MIVVFAVIAVLTSVGFAVDIAVIVLDLNPPNGSKWQFSWFRSFSLYKPITRKRNTVYTHKQTQITVPTALNAAVLCSVKLP